MKLYTSLWSSNARRAAMTAILLKLPVERIEVDLAGGAQRKPEFLKLNPNGKVPVLVDGDLFLWESIAIMQYLADGVPGNALYPTGRRERADVNRWLFWSASHWQPAIAGLNFENMLKAMFGMGAPDAGQVQRHEGVVQQSGAVLDAHLKDRQWLTPSGMTLADITVATTLMYTDSAKLPVKGFANVQRWFEQVRTLDAWKETEPAQR